MLAVRECERRYQVFCSNLYPEHVGVGSWSLDLRNHAA